MKDNITLMRHLLASIVLSDIQEEIDVKEHERRMVDAEIFYKNHFEKLLKGFVQKQLEFIGKEAKDLEQLSFGRGTINGFILIKEWFEEQTKDSLARFDKEEKEELETGEIKPV